MKQVCSTYSPLQDLVRFMSTKCCVITITAYTVHVMYETNSEDMNIYTVWPPEILLIKARFIRRILVASNAIKTIDNEMINLIKSSIV